MSKYVEKNMRDKLSEVFWLEKEINILREKIEYQRARQQGGGRIGGTMGVKISRQIDRQGDISAEILDLEGEAAALYLELLKADVAARLLFGRLDDSVQKAILIWRYICRLKWEDVADKAELSVPQVIRIHNTAITLLAAMDDTIVA